MKGVELPQLLLPLRTLDREDAHQQRFRVANDLIVYDRRVVVERLNIIPRFATNSPDFLQCIIERLARYLQLLRVESKKVEEVIVESEQGEGTLRPFQSHTPRVRVIVLRQILDATMKHDCPAELVEENIERFEVEAPNIDQHANLPY